MNGVHVEAFDLNLLLAFDALFVASPRGLMPTPRAHALAPPLAEALTLVRNAVKPPEFVPATAQRTIIIGSNDYGDVALLPQLVARLEREAPGVRLTLRPIVGDGVRALLDGEHDLMFGVPQPAAPDVFGETLFHDRFVSLLRAGHPAAHRPLTLDRFVTLRHLLISPQGVGEAAVDVALRAVGRERVIAVRMPHFLSAPLVVAQTDLIVTMPQRVAQAVSGQQRFVVHQPPVELPTITFNMFWHARNDADPLHRWIRALAATMARDGNPPAPSRTHARGSGEDASTSARGTRKGARTDERGSGEDARTSPRGSGAGASTSERGKRKDARANERGSSENARTRERKDARTSARASNKDSDTSERGNSKDARTHERGSSEGARTNARGKREDARTSARGNSKDARTQDAVGRDRKPRGRRRR